MTRRPAKGISIVRLIGARSKSVTTSLLFCAALLAALPARAAPPTPIRIAVFDFEFEDSSAGASSDQAPVDTAWLAQVTAEVRQLLAESGRYSLVATGRADASAAKAHMLRVCDGCDAA